MQWLGSCGPRQLCHPQAPEGARLARPPSARHLPLHPDLVFLANAVEGWFAKLTRQRLKRGVFTSIARHPRDPGPLPPMPPTPSTTLLSIQQAKERMREIVEGLFFRRLNTEDGGGLCDLVQHQGGDLLYGAPQGLSARGARRGAGDARRGTFRSRRVRVRAVIAMMALAKASTAPTTAPNTRHTPSTVVAGRKLRNASRGSPAGDR